MTGLVLKVIRSFGLIIGSAIAFGFLAAGMSGFFDIAVLINEKYGMVGVTFSVGAAMGGTASMIWLALELVDDHWRQPQGNSRRQQHS